MAIQMTDPSLSMSPSSKNTSLSLHSLAVAARFMSTQRPRYTLYTSRGHAYTRTLSQLQMTSTAPPCTSGNSATSLSIYFRCFEYQPITNARRLHSFQRSLVEQWCSFPTAVHPLRQVPVVARSLADYIWLTGHLTSSAIECRMHGAR